jgi:hypothetical protein
MATESTEPIERWTGKRRVALVVSILKSEIHAACVGSVGQAGLHRPVTARRRRPAADLPLIELLRRLIQQYPTFGYRHL